MPQKTKETQTKLDDYNLRPALTPEAEEQQCISLATNLAKKQLLEGTASSQVITHFLKLGSSLAMLEKEKLEYEKLLLQAKTDSLQSSRRTEEMYKEALEAFKSYGGAYNNNEPSET